MVELLLLLCHHGLILHCISVHAAVRYCQLEKDGTLLISFITTYTVATKYAAFADTIYKMQLLVDGILDTSRKNRLMITITFKKGGFNIFCHTQFL